MNRAKEALTDMREHWDIGNKGLFILGLALIAGACLGLAYLISVEF